MYSNEWLSYVYKHLQGTSVKPLVLVAVEDA